MDSTLLLLPQHLLTRSLKKQWESRIRECVNRGLKFSNMCGRCCGYGCRNSYELLAENEEDVEQEKFVKQP